MKPYGISFDTTPIGQNTSDMRHEKSIWYYDPPSLIDKAIHLIGGILKFRQADMTALALGHVQIIAAALYPIERGFFNNELGTGHLSDLALDFITSVGRNRIDYIQHINNYFEDVCLAYNYMKQLSGEVVPSKAGPCKYLLVKNFSEISGYLAANPDDRTIFVMITIEGMHALISDLANDPQEASLLNNLNVIKKWQYAPFFITFAHHFYNFLCGNARSLDGIVASTVDQSDHLDTGFTPLGERILHAVLDKDNGRRILIDIKHMSALSRKRYFEILATDYAGEQIPVIASHAACNGLRSMDEPVADSKETSHKMLALDINFYDNEILVIARSGGLFCLQLDERRIASAETLSDVPNAIQLDKIRYYRAELMWNQVQHVVELLDRHDLFAWDCLAMGSDFDGIINPLNGYLTAENFDELEENLQKYAAAYMGEKGKALQARNQLPAGEIVRRIFYDNAFAFLKKWF
jgi:microsomal dipeptidase-like Zn-dependent dipeptidase